MPSLFSEVLCLALLLDMFQGDGDDRRTKSLTTKVWRCPLSLSRLGVEEPPTLRGTARSTRCAVPQEER